MSKHGFNIILVISFVACQPPAKEGTPNPGTNPSGSETPGGNNGGETPGGGPAIAGFRVPLTAGGFWDYRWRRKTSSYGKPTGTADGTFRVALGDETQIGDKAAFAVRVFGPHGGFAPRWKYLHTGPEGLFGSTDGATWSAIVDAQSGTVSGFFVALPQGVTYKPSMKAFSNALIQGSGLVIARSVSTTDDVCVEGFGCVNGTSGDVNLTQEETYLTDVAPAAYTFFFSFTQGMTGQYSTSEEVGLAASSARGEVGLFVSEQEPNDAPEHAPQALTTDTGMLGTFAAGDPGTHLTHTYYNPSGILLGTRTDDMQDCYDFDAAASAHKHLTLTWDAQACVGCTFSIVLFSAAGEAPFAIDTTSLINHDFSTGSLSAYLFDVQVAKYGARYKACVGTSSPAPLAYALQLD